MRKLLATIFLLIASYTYAHHLKGGWIFYEYLGKGTAPNTSKYRITVKQYLNCQSTQGQIDREIYLGIYDGINNRSYTTLTIPLGNAAREQLDISRLNPCINPKPLPNDVCYIIDSYTTTVDLPDNTGGYTLAVQRCCRIDEIINVQDDPSRGVGITYTTNIPGLINNISFRENNSPVFAQIDTAVICINSFFTFNFSAADEDGDSLSYSFCEGLLGGDNSQTGAQPNPPSNPPYQPITYAQSFGGSFPLGSGVTINSVSGIISGIAPGSVGTYVVAVCASEFRRGVFIGSTKKEIHITVANCQLSGAQLKPSYITCNGYDFAFSNESPAGNITSYLWNFGVPNNTTDTSTKAKPVYTYSDTGEYDIALIVKNAQGCSDSAYSKLKIYPGFTPEFKVAGNCLQTPYRFFDQTITKYGVVDSWNWNLGDETNDSDISTLQNPTYQYATASVKPVQLIVTNSKGCIDTILKQVEVRDRPLINLPFTDTLICSIDSLQLSASTNIATSYSWLPNDNTIINANTANPVVFPKDTTAYIVHVDDGKGCVNSDTITVNVIDKVDVNIGADTSVCLTDSLKFNTVSNALKFVWTPTETLNNSNIKNPVAVPSGNIIYKVIASVGKCSAADVIDIKVAPYPQADAGFASPICYGTAIQLNASVTGSSYTWSPVTGLTRSNTLTPLARPLATTTYILSVTDTVGCPKAVSDTVTVKVIPPVKAFAGNDTAIVINQPLQLNATGGTVYLWSPSTGMSNIAIPNPVAILGAAFDSIIYKVRVSTPEGCFADDSIKVKIFKTLPEIFIPTAFTPNADGRNDILKPIIAGIKKLEFFSLYNRWGQMLFTTSEVGKGWDGTINGIQQPSGTYVVVAKAINYLGETVIKKGTVVLIR